MRNLGPKSEADLVAAGISTPAELISVGAEAAFLRIIESRRARGESLTSLNAIYLYALYGAIHNLDWRKIPDHQKQHFKQITQQMRAYGKR